MTPTQHPTTPVEALLFLDIDGVLNGHEKQTNGYCGIQPHCVAHLNAILAAVPEVKLVISSAWRYLIDPVSMSLRGFEAMLLTHGVHCHQRLHGRTADDPRAMSFEDYEELGCEWRREQIHKYAAASGAEVFAVLDDLSLDMPELVQTDGWEGLTAEDATRVIDMLSGARCSQGLKDGQLPTGSGQRVDNPRPGAAP